MTINPVLTRRVAQRSLHANFGDIFGGGASGDQKGGRRFSMTITSSGSSGIPGSYPDRASEIVYVLGGCSGSPL